ncbi:MAG: glycosyltransferase family 2 protein [Deltaproteobacteria bacterium]|jgi:glycosyltransferase involved in cell wall biosynthesis|nr:glycosyltransferase family 2 protein [Deltaproteobacteria bacterium]
MPKLCVLIPAYNSAHFLPDLIGQAAGYLPSEDDGIIVLDDGSSDDTFGVANSLPRVKAYSNGTNRGYGYTSQRLFRLALENGADYAIHMHSDFNHDPANIAKLITYSEEKSYDMIVGSRLLFLYDLYKKSFWSLLSNKNRNNMPLIRVAGHFAVTALQNFCYGTDLHCYHDGMRLTGKRTMEWIVAQDMPHWYHYDGQLYMRLATSGFRIGEVPIPPFYNDLAKSSAPPFRYGMKCVALALKHKFGRK